MFLNENNLETKARKGDAANQLMLGAILLNKLDTVEINQAVVWLEKAAEHCEAASLYLAIINRIGYKVPKNDSLAEKYFQSFENSETAKFHLALGKLISDRCVDKTEDENIVDQLSYSAMWIGDDDPFVVFVKGVLEKEGILGCIKCDRYEAVQDFYKASKLGYKPAKEFFHSLYAQILQEAKDGSLDARYALAEIYLSESGKKNEEKGLALLHSLAKENYPDALKDLGFHYTRGYLVDEDREKGLEFYKRAAIWGPVFFARDYYNLTHETQISSSCEDEVLNEFAASLGNNEAKYEYWRELSYQWVKTSPEKLNKGLLWLKEAAEAGYPEANKSLGDMYLRGENGVEKDLVKARRCYEKCIGTDCYLGICSLAKMYIKGQGGPANLERGLALFESVKASGEYYADICLGQLYQDGDGVPQDLEKALELYDTAYVYGEDVDYRDDFLEEMEEEGITLSYPISTSSGIPVDEKLINILETAYQEELQKIASDPLYLYEKLDDDLKEAIQSEVHEDFDDDLSDILGYEQSDTDNLLKDQSQQNVEHTQVFKTDTPSMKDISKTSLTSISSMKEILSVKKTTEKEPKGVAESDENRHCFALWRAMERVSAGDVAKIFAQKVVFEFDNVDGLLSLSGSYVGFFKKLFSKDEMRRKYIPVAQVYHGALAERLWLRFLIDLYDEIDKEVDRQWIDDFHKTYWSVYPKWLQHMYPDTRNSSQEYLLGSLRFYENMPLEIFPCSMGGFLYLVKNMPDAMQNLEAVGRYTDSMFPSGMDWLKVKQVPPGTGPNAQNVYNRHQEVLDEIVTSMAEIFTTYLAQNALEEKTREFNEQFSDLEIGALGKDVIQNMCSTQFVDTYILGLKTQGLFS